jgi:hypothetical protein
MRSNNEDLETGGERRPIIIIAIKRVFMRNYDSIL